MSETNEVHVYDAVRRQLQLANNDLIQVPDYWLDGADDAESRVAAHARRFGLIAEGDQVVGLY